jgi:hypothetical protein
MKEQIKSLNSQILKGLSVRNLKYMRAFAEAGPDFGIMGQAAAQMRCGHCQVRIQE